MPATEAQAGPVRGLDAAALGDVLAAVLDLVRDHEDELNRLNVFPVRDHDTGTNMTLTLEGAVKAVEATSGRPMRELARAVVDAAMVEARGNSGTILAEVLRGLFETWAPLELVGPADVNALLAGAAEAAGRAVEATTGQLAALRRAGVVDAAARGFELCVRAFATTVAEEGPRAAPPSRRGSSVGGSPASRSPTLATPPGPADPISTISPIGRRAVGQHDLRLLLGLTAQVADSHRVPGAERPQRRQEVLHAGDLLAVDRGDHVTGLEPGLGGGTAADHVEHDHAAAGAHPELLGRLRRQVARLDAEERVPRAPALQELADDADRGVGRDGEADRHRPLRRRDERFADPDHLPAGVHHRAAGVAGRDGRVGLDQVDQRLRLLPGPRDVPVQAGDDPGGDGVLEAQRAADRDRQVADPRQLPLEGRRRQALAGDLDHRQVGHRVGGAHRPAHPAPVGEGHLDPLAAADDVLVGDDDAVSRPDHPAAEALTGDD